MQRTTFIIVINIFLLIGDISVVVVTTGRCSSAGIRSIEISHDYGTLKEKTKTSPPLIMNNVVKTGIIIS